MNKTPVQDDPSPTPASAADSHDGTDEHGGGEREGSSPAADGVIAASLPAAGRVTRPIHGTGASGGEGARPDGDSAAGGGVAEGPAAPTAPPVLSGPPRSSGPDTSPLPPVPPVPPLPPLWPRPKVPEGSSKGLVWGALAAGLLGAVVGPYERAGLGLALIGVAIMVAALPAIRTRLTRPWPLAFGTIATLLLVTCTLLDAGWVVAPCVALSALLASIAVADVTGGWAALTRGATSVARALYPSAFFLAKPLSGTGRRVRLPAVSLGAGLTVAVLAVFVPLLAGADPAFSRLVDDLWQTERLPDLMGRAFVFGVVALITGAVAVAALRPREERAPRPGPRALDRTVWVPPLAALCLLFAVFLAVQARVLFGGERRILETAGVTYADAAREGFFQLVTTAALVLVVVALASWRVPRERPADRVLLGWMLGVLYALTLILLASAAHRLYLYTEAYGLTIARMQAAGVAWWLAIVFVLLLVAGPGRRRGWLPRAVALATGVALLSFAAVNPDARIADSQIARSDRLSGPDARELGELSADAAPALQRLPEPTRACVFSVMAGEIGDDGWAGWNLSRVRARGLLAGSSGPMPNYTETYTGCPVPR